MGTRSALQTGRVGRTDRSGSDGPSRRFAAKTALGRLLAKLGKIERNLSFKHGEFTLFGLFLREEAPARWDLVVAAAWGTDRLAMIKLVSDALIKALTKEEAILISRVVPLDPDDGFLKAVRKAVSVRHGLEKVAGEFDVVSIQDGYVISCGRPAGN